MLPIATYPEKRPKPNYEEGFTKYSVKKPERILILAHEGDTSCPIDPT